MAVVGAAVAAAPDRSARPEMRPNAASIAQSAAAPVAAGLMGTARAPAASARPAPRDLSGAGRQLASPVPATDAQTRAARAPLSPTGSALATPQSLRPALRPDGAVRTVSSTAARSSSSAAAQIGQAGALCGQAGLTGERLSPITARVRGCGIAEPVRLRVVDGITLSTPATVNCETARALQTWVKDTLVPTVGRHGGGVRSLRVVASYACRTRNNQPGGRISEHGRGNAIDIAGIGLADGTELTVLTDWRTRRAGRMLQQMHAGACGPFGTVLGPNSDRFHRDHFHFDVARHRSGPFCR